MAYSKEDFYTQLEKLNKEQYIQTTIFECLRKVEERKKRKNVEEDLRVALLSIGENNNPIDVEDFGNINSADELVSYITKTKGNITSLEEQKEIENQGLVDRQVEEDKKEFNNFIKKKKYKKHKCCAIHPRPTNFHVVEGFDCGCCDNCTYKPN